MKFTYNDGGRRAAGFKGDAGDCVVRAVAIATQQPYITIYNALSTGSRAQRKTKRSSVKASARDGVYTRRKWFRDYMKELGWQWVPTMGIGTGCKVHLTAGELPSGRLIVSVSRHYTAVIDGVVHDTYNPTRDYEELQPDLGQSLQTNQRRLGPYDPKYENTVGGGHGIATSRRRCVYGYWRSSHTLDIGEPQ